MTPEEQLAYERQLAEVIKIRQPSGGSSTLKTFLNSGVVVALIGVVGTGCFGAWVSNRIQQRSKDIEFERKSHDVRIEAQRAAMTDVLKKVNALEDTTDDLLVSINVAYSESGRRKDEIAELRKWRMGLTQSRDTADREWRREKKTLGFTLSYLFDSVATLRHDWQGVLETVDTFEDCTRRFYSINAITLTDAEVNAICSPERKALDAALERFTGVVGAAGAAQLNAR